MKIKAVFRRSGVRLALFLLVLCLIFRFCNTFMIKVDLFAYLALDELEHTDGIELAVVGSSLVQNHVNPEIIEEITGKSTYNASVPYMSYPGAYALTDQMLDHNSPEQIVLVVDPVGFCSTAESIESQFRLTPHLKGFARRARYFMDVCRENGNYLERLWNEREEYIYNTPGALISLLHFSLTIPKTHTCATFVHDVLARYSLAGVKSGRCPSIRAMERMLKDYVVYEGEPLVQTQEWGEDGFMQVTTRRYAAYTTARHFGRLAKRAVLGVG